MKTVTIVGGGMSGLAAALRLAERGYKVTILERDNFVGGKFRATEWSQKGKVAYHEHSYHMFLNWYHNFWGIANEIGARDKFKPMTSVKFLHKGKFPEMQELVNFGAPSAILQNLFSGVLPVPDMFLYMYSIIDLLSTPMQQGEARYHDLISINAFASTKPYSTELSVGMYDEYLAKTFAVASYQSATRTFKTFIEYGTYNPTPLYWALSGDCFNHFLAPLVKKLEDLGVDLRLGQEVTGIKLDAHGLVSELDLQRYSETFNPSMTEYTREYQHDMYPRRRSKYRVRGPVILAVPHAALGNLLNDQLLQRSPELGESAKLQSVPMASVHLHLNEKFAQRLQRTGVSLPGEPVVLLDSKYKLSFVANSRIWPGIDHTYLNIVASDSRPLNKLDAPTSFTSDKERGVGSLNLEAPATAIEHILHEFRKFVHFENNEIEIELVQIDRNVGRELFINEVGSWKWRPTTRTRVENLFLAGDYCKTFIDVVSLEAATVSGLQAAECVRQYCGLGDPIKILRPKRYPSPLFWPLKLALAPYAVAAKLWCTVGDIRRKLMA
jgi:protoporphyrinogen oxidase